VGTENERWFGVLKDLRSDAEGAVIDPTKPNHITVDVSMEETIWAKVIYFYSEDDLRRDGGRLVSAQKYAPDACSCENI
jgi:hypothetical protein